MDQVKRQNEVMFGTDGKIQYHNELLGKYNQYLNDNFRYATAEHKALEASIAEPIAKEMIEDNAFVQNEIRNNGD